MKKTLKLSKHLLLSLTLATACVANAGGPKTWGSASDVTAIGLPLVALGNVYVKGDTEGFKELSYTLGSAFAASEVLKSVIHEKRPDGSGIDGFPSGHAAVAFAAAHFMDKRYDAEFSPYLYAVAGFTALARVKADKHYAHDVLAGAGLGVFSAEYFTHPVSGGQVSLMPAKSGLAVVWQTPLF
jgi:membrane-associated phospholipid phosphatase